ncbi:hypothetical protein Tco_0754205 [Tanacetum coccineum]
MVGMTSMGRMGDTGHLGGESLGRLGGQDMGCLGGQRMELSGGGSIGRIPDMKNTRPNTTGASVVQKGFLSLEGVDSVLHDDPWMIGGISTFLNKWSPSGHSSYARVLIEINACNDFSDTLVMVVPNLEELDITKKLFILNTSGNLLVMGKLVLLDDAGKPLEKDDYPVNSDSTNEVEPVENKLQIFWLQMELDMARKALIKISREILNREKNKLEERPLEIPAPLLNLPASSSRVIEWVSQYKALKNIPSALEKIKIAL